MNGMGAVPFVARVEVALVIERGSLDAGENEKGVERHEENSDHHG